MRPPIFSDHESKNFQANRREDGFGFLPGPYDLNQDGITREAMCIKNFGHGWRPLGSGDDVAMAAKVSYRSKYRFFDENPYIKDRSLHWDRARV